MLPARSNKTSLAPKGYFASSFGLIGFSGKGGDGSLRIHVGNDTYPLVVLANGRFRLGRTWLSWLRPPEAVERLEFAIRTDRGHRFLVGGEHGQEYLLGSELAMPAIHPAWQPRLGRYRYAGNDDLMRTLLGQVELFVGQPDDDRTVPVMQVRMLGDEGASYPLDASHPDFAVFQGIGSGLGGTIRVSEKEGQVGLVYSGMPFFREL